MPEGMNPVIVAFLQARQLAQQQAESIMEEERKKEELKVEKDRLKEQQRQFNEEQKRVGEQFKAKQKLDEAIFQVQKSQAIMKGAEELSKRGLGKVGPIPIEQSLEIARTSTRPEEFRRGFEFIDTPIPGTDVVIPSSLLQTQEEALRPTLAPIEARYRGQITLQSLRDQFQQEQQQRLFGQQEKIAKLQMGSREAISKYHEEQANYRAGLARKGLQMDTVSLRLAQQHDTSPLTKRYITGREAIGFINSLPSTSATPADDIGLIYIFAKAMDPESVVREGEYKTIQDYSQALLTKFGYKLRRVWANKEFLAPEAKEFMKGTIRSKVASTENMYHTYRSTISNRIDQLSRTLGHGEIILGPFLSDKIVSTQSNLPGKNINENPGRFVPVR